jgi:hypothetical protein
MSQFADRVRAAALVMLVLGSVLCFGGAVWWFRVAAGCLAMLLALATLVPFLISGRIPFLKSPLTFLGLLALALGTLQLAPMPAHLARVLSPGAQAIYSQGALPDLVHADDPGAGPIEPAPVRSPVTLDRAATLRWLVGALVCLAVFWSVSHFADRVNRLYLVWGCVVAGCLLNGAFGFVQITCGSDGLFGFLRPGQAPIWAPSIDDLLESPTAATLHRLDLAGAAPGAGLETFALVPEAPVLFGTMVGSRGAFLALSSLALPLLLAVVLHLVSPRGSCESLATRLWHTGQGSLVVLSMGLLIVSAFLVGSMAGAWFCAPFALGLAVAAIPAFLARASRRIAISLASVVLLSLALGVGLVAAWPVIVGGKPPIEPVVWESIKLLWNESLPAVRGFPWVGTGFGSFATIYPYFKSQDATSTTAMSSLLQCALESGGVGLALLGAAAVWSLVRLPSCLKLVGSADRTLAYGLIGAAVSFGLWFVVHWTIELPAVAISASAVGGTWNRWLSGGTDMFVERG